MRMLHESRWRSSDAPARCCAVVLAACLLLHFVTQVAAAELRWSTEFNPPGVDAWANVNCALHSGDDLYVGGRFTQIGSLPARNVAHWDGTAWRTLGGGLEGPVQALALFDGRLVACVYSFEVDPATSLFWSWDGSAWRALGSGWTGSTEALVAHDGALYAAGAFWSLPDSTVHHILRWNGADWESFDPGFESDGWGHPEVTALATWHGRLVIAGSFDRVGGVAMHNAAMWDGSTWLPVGEGPPAGVSSLVEFEGGLVATARSLSSSPPHKCIVRWDGEAWTGIGFDFHAYCGHRMPLVVHAGRLFAAGSLYHPDAPPGTRSSIVAWNGEDWDFVVAVEGGGTWMLLSWDERLLVGGRFFAVGGRGASGLAAIDASGVHAMAEGAGLAGARELPGFYASAGAHAFAEYQGRLVVGGSFLYAGTEAAPSIAAWDGRRWHPLGSGVEGVVRSLAVYDGELVAAGTFRSAGGVPVNNIAAWDGARWRALGPGISSDLAQYDEVRTLAVAEGRLHAGGWFHRAGPLWVYNAACWDGASWSRSGSGLFYGVRQLLVTPEGLFAGGDFDWNGRETVRHVARWDGGGWQPMGSGTPVRIVGLAQHGGRVVAAGEATFRQGAVVLWDGTAWSQVGGIVPGEPMSVESYQDRILVAGERSENNRRVGFLDAWDGEAWRPLVSGIDSRVLALRTIGTSLYVGGWFAGVGGISSSHMARLDAPLAVDVEGLEVAAWNDGAQLSWRLSDEAVARLRGVDVERAAARDGSYVALTGEPLAPAPAMSYFDATLVPGAGAWYRLVLRETDGSTTFAGPVGLEAGASSAVLEVPFEHPDGSVSIRYRAGTTRLPLRLEIFDVRGRSLATLGARPEGLPGVQEARWDRLVHGGGRAPRGIYLVRLSTPSTSASRKFVLVRP